MTNQQIIYRNLEAAIVAWAEDQCMARGDIFATERDLENIRAEPLAFGDMLQGEDAYGFLRRCLEVAREAQEAIDNGREN